MNLSTGVPALPQPKSDTSTQHPAAHHSAKASDPLKRRHVIIVLFVKAAISIAFVWLVFTKIPFAVVIERIGQTNWPLLAFTMPLAVLSIVLSAVRWRMLSLNLFPLGVAIRYTWIGLFFGAILPGGISGDFVKGASLAYKERDTRVARLPLSILIDRTIGFCALLILFDLCCGALVSGWIEHESKLNGFSRVGFEAGAVLLLLIGICASRLGNKATVGLIAHTPGKKLRDLVGRLHTALYDAAARPVLLAAALGISLLIHFTNTLIYYLIIRSLGAVLDPVQILIFYTTLSVIVMIPISVSGVGLRDWFSMTFFAAAGLNGETGVAFAWVTLGVSLTIALIGALLQLWEFFGTKVAGPAGGLGPPRA
jgi:uncharacterized membrane protein YbhN (UPF0104 family)